jgi:hypothetical protein
MSVIFFQLIILPAQPLYGIPQPAQDSSLPKSRNVFRQLTNGFLIFSLIARSIGRVGEPIDHRKCQLTGMVLPDHAAFFRQP